MDRIKIGIIGCGVISDIYLTNLTGMFGVIEVAACADMFVEKAQSQAAKYNIPKACTPQELLEDPAIKIVVNLTTPLSHYEVAKAALLAGKHVYTEKPLSVNREQGRELLELAIEKNLLLGGAPDTFLGAGIQACRKAIDEGLIGDIVGAVALFTCPGHERWHPAPAFYYEVGGGPVLDVGPYYLTALVNLIGPVAAVTGHARKTYAERTVSSEPLKGQKIPVEVPTHYSMSLQFENGAIGTMIHSFDVWGANLPRIEIYGSKGSLSAPDPNTFGGPAKILLAGESEWTDLPLEGVFTEESRGLGVADMAYSIINKRDFRANGQLTYHVLDVMEGMDDAAQSERHYHIQSSCERPAAMPGSPNPEGWD